jgi:uroporphyrinogen decarboxylase
MNRALMTDAAFRSQCGGAETAPLARSWHRVDDALHHRRPDRLPRDFLAVPEVWSRLESRLNVRSRAEVLVRLGVDCRVVSYDSFCRHPDEPPDQVDWSGSLDRSSLGGMYRRREADGSTRDIWGAHRRRVETGQAAHDEFVSHPLGNARSLEDLQGYRWPDPSWWNFDGLRAEIDALNQPERYHIRFRVGSVFETAWSLCGFERFLFDLAAAPQLPRYVMERITEVHLANLRGALAAAGDRIDLVYFYDDVATQTGLLIGPAMYDSHIRPFHQRLIDEAARQGKPVMLHCCGAVFPLISRFIDMGLRVLNPIQPRARGMAPENLVRNFGGRLAFHGGIDIQELLPGGTPAQVRAEAARVGGLLGERGGYILAGSHHIQADTPVENILAMYSVD